LVDVFALNLAERVILPEWHFTVVSNPTTFGVDNHAQVLAFLTVAVNLIVPPFALKL